MAMSLPRASVRRPVFTTMVVLIVVVLGLTALGRLQIDLLPSIELPTVSVRTQYPGADPLVIERAVTQIVEEIVATVPGVEEISSSSYEGNSSVRVTFGWGTDVDSAAIDVRATLEDEISELPDDIVGPRVGKFDVDSYPVVILGISSPLDPVELTELLEQQIRYRFARIPGVAQVDPWGGFDRELRVEIDPARLNALGLPLNDVLQALRDGNVDLPTGSLREGRYEVTLRAPAEFASLDDIRQTVVGRADGAFVTLDQIAAVRDTYAKLSRIVRVNGERGLRVAIRKQAGANTVEVAQRVLEEVDALNRALPQVRIVPVSNQGNYIQRSIDNVASSVLYGGVLAVLVLLLFLRDLRSTLVIAVAIPISVIATFALLYFGGFTLNLMTLGGLALGVGMMVDSAVVVLENIFRRRTEHGDAPAKAAVRGAREVGAAVIAGTLTTLVIFLPLIFVRGVSGVLFQELAFVIMFALGCALLVALSLVPMLASRLLRAGPLPAEPIGPSPGQAAKPGTMPGYGQLLDLALRHRVITVLGAAGVFAFTLLFTAGIGTEFLPPSDEGEVRVTGEMDVGTHLDLLDRQTRLLEARVYAAVPEAIASVVSITPSGSRGSARARGEVRLSLPPATQRDRSNTEIAAALRQIFAQDGVPGMKVRVRAPQGQFLLERLLKSTEGITIEVRGYELTTLERLGKRLASQIEDIKGVTDVDVGETAGVPQREVLVDRRKAADLGLSVRDVIEVIETAVAGSQAGEYRILGSAYRILVQLADAEQRTLDEILDLTLSTPDGNRVSLRHLVHTREGTGPVTIKREDQQRVVSITANVAGRDLGSVARDIEAAIADIPAPVGYAMVVAGNFAEQQEAFNELVLALGLALVLVYMVLAAQYESFSAPLIVMLAVPMAAIGVIASLQLTDTTLNLQSAIGCILLGGIVVNNAILLVDQAVQLQRQGMDALTAAREAGRRRLRPVLMTTSTTILALLPLALGIGEGADAQAPMARVVVGGLLSSTLITLLMVPAAYALWFAGKRNEQVPAPAPDAGAGHGAVTRS